MKQKIDNVFFIIHIVSSAFPCNLYIIHSTNLPLLHKTTQTSSLQYNLFAVNFFLMEVTFSTVAFLNNSLYPRKQRYYKVITWTDSDQIHTTWLLKGYINTLIVALECCECNIRVHLYHINQAQECLSHSLKVWKIFKIHDYTKIQPWFSTCFHYQGSVQYSYDY